MKDLILNHNQKKILKNLAFLKKYDVYLAGGTALAIQLGHRTSQDLDFYTLKSFDSTELMDNFHKAFGQEVEEGSREKDTLYLKIKQTDLSFFKYPYKLIRPLAPYQTIKMASVEDIGAMKIEAIFSRGTKRDFVDIYFLIKKFGLEKLLKFQKEKYPERFNVQEYLRTLMYFGDAEKKQQGRFRIYIYDNIDWLEIKKGIIKAVKDYQLNLIK